MIRTLLYLFAGLVLGGIIHLVVILILPLLTPNAAWERMVALNAENRAVVLPAAVPGTPNPLRLDPELTYAVCRLNLSSGPGSVSGTLPSAFWSVAVYGRAGTVLYATSNRDGIGQRLEVGVFNASQTRLLAERRLDVAEGLLIVESREDDVFVVVRLAPAHEVMRTRYEAALAGLVCGNLG